MKAIIKYNLDNEDDLFNYNLHNNSSNMHSFLHELLLNKKKELLYKYDNPEYDNKSTDEVLALVFEDIWELADNNNLAQLFE